ncbi:hypothetical protein OG871_10915 [Kitasatospora sp. NBC_00374]|uniref:hypothetical protein n=1 Tax=Kitasatospora sp. NBC_00374 TaxID=2975964 RepID=UPI0030E3F688
MDLEQRLNGMLEQTVDGLQPPVPAMVGEGTRLGRRRRLRRRLQLAGAVVAVAALAGAGTLAGLDRRAGGPGPEAAAPVPVSVSPSAVASPAPATGAEPTTDLSWQAMLKILSDELPPGARFGNLDAYYMKASSPGAHELTLEYDDGHGPVTLGVTLRPAVRADQHPLTCATWGGGSDEGPRPAGAEPVSCAQRVLADGSSIFSYVTGADFAGLYDEGVQITRPDGWVLQIVAANGTLNAWSAAEHITVTRPRPPVGIAGWERVAQSPGWQTKVPQSTADAGVLLARGVSRLECPVADKAQCEI